VHPIPGRNILGILAALSGLWLHPSAATPTRALTADAAEVFDWVARSRDNDGLPFMIIDKRQAHLWVFDSSGKPQGNAPVLLGVARGDDTAPGIGDKKLSEIKSEERTTPAGRFVAEVGMNARGEDVVWVDYDAAVSMHRVLTTNAKEQRARRLETPTPNDNRVSYGCINVPRAFFENVVRATVRGGNSVVYVLPESRPLRSVFSRLATAQSNLTTARR
jgi:hypothetical protein